MSGRVESHAFFVHTSDDVRLALAELRLRDSQSDLTDHVFLLVHGFAQNRSAYTLGGLPQAILRRGARVFIAELRNHGRSERGTGGLTRLLRFDLPALIREVCRRAEVDRLHLIGHSMGGILGYALLDRPHRLRSLTTLAAPVILGRDRRLLRLAARVTAPALRRLTPKMVPMDRLLRAVEPMASRRVRGPLFRIREAVRLANPAAADPERTRQVLGDGHAVPRGLLLDLADIARTGRAVIDGVDLEQVVIRSRLPIAAVVGARDVFGGEASVAPVTRGPGPRKVWTLPEVAHVDITLGHHCEHIAAELFAFLNAES